MPETLQIGVTMDIVRINYECPDADCGTAYTERQFASEGNPTCGRCGGSLTKLTLVVGRREPCPSSDG